MADNRTACIQSQSTKLQTDAYYAEQPQQYVYKE